MYSVAGVCWEERNVPTVEFGPHKAAVSGKRRRHTMVLTARHYTAAKGGQPEDALLQVSTCHPGVQLCKMQAATLAGSQNLPSV